LIPSFFYAKISEKNILMDKDKLKLIIRNLELLVDSLKAEVYSDISAYKYDNIQPRELDYDEIFEDSE
jgi:hypothetical protein